MYNKFIKKDGEVLLDLTDDSVSSSDLLEGVTAHDKSGEKITGTMPDNGIISTTMDGINTKSISIPSGYTSGGTVSLNNTIDNEVNEQYDLISQIKNVVDTLPEAGSGSIETCTVTLVGEAPAFSEDLIYYINGSSSVQSSNLPDFNERFTITVLKNSILFINAAYGQTSGDIMCFNPTGYDSRGFFVYGEARIEFR